MWANKTEVFSAENVAKKYSVTREDQDKLAAESQQRAEHAQKEGYFQKEIVPVVVPGKKGDVIVSQDEYPRHGTTTESLAKLIPTYNNVSTFSFLKNSMNKYNI